jgi:hypothetical protein
MSVLSNAVDTEGDLPDELTARLDVKLELEGHPPLAFQDTLSGLRYSGPMGPVSLFGPVANAVAVLTKNPLRRVRIERIETKIEIEPTRTSAAIETVRLASDRVEPGRSLEAFVTIKPHKRDREVVVLKLPIPADMPEGSYEASVGDVSNALRRRFRNEPQLTEPRDVAGVVRLIRAQTDLSRKAISIAVQRPDRGVTVQGQSLPSLPGSVRAVFNTPRQTPEPGIRSDLTAEVETPWVIEGSQSLRFTVTKDRGLSLAEPR